MRALLVEYEPYCPWDVERAAVESVGGTLDVVTADEFAAGPTDCDVLLNVYAAPAPARILDRMPSLRCAVSYGIGVDWIDLDDATARGIQVVNMPLANVEEVATHTVALILACTRRLSELDRHVRAGGWDGSRARPIHRLAGRRLGLLAFGNIARRVAELVRPFGLAVSAHDPHVDPELIFRHGVEPMTLDGLLSTIDILSVHLPSTPATRGLLDDSRLALLPSGAILVITSRGDVYDSDAVARALGEGRLAAAGLDVFPNEPLEADHPLRDVSTAILTPHVAGYSEAAIRDLHTSAAEIVEALANRLPFPGRVNAPGQR